MVRADQEVAAVILAAMLVVGVVVGVVVVVAAGMAVVVAAGMAVMEGAWTRTRCFDRPWLHRWHRPKKMKRNADQPRASRLPM